MIFLISGFEGSYPTNTTMTTTNLDTLKNQIKELIRPLADNRTDFFHKSIQLNGFPFNVGSFLSNWDVLANEEGILIPHTPEGKFDELFDLYFKPECAVAQ